MAEWKAIPGHPNYDVSDDGQVRSMPHYAPVSRGDGLRLYPGKLLKEKVTRYGYRSVSLCKPGRQRTDGLVHRLVALAFLPNPDQKKQVNHKDGDKQNNRLTNLEWCTHIENIRHRIHELRLNVAENCKNPKLTLEQVRAIRADQRLLREIAAEHGVSMALVSKIRRRETWALLAD